MNTCTHPARALVLVCTITHPEHRHIINVICNCVKGLGGCGEDVRIDRSGAATLVRTRSQVHRAGNEGDTIGARNGVPVGGGSAPLDLGQHSREDGVQSGEVCHDDDSDPGDGFARHLNGAHTGQRNPAE